VHAFVPHAEAMRDAALVIGHGGHGTTALALAHGIPLVILPASPSFDQPVIARTVQRLGLGRALPGNASSSQIVTAVRAVLGDPRYREAAGRFGARMRARDGLARAVALLEE
jgi:UDP:flavonoid glycosyltransferase YjiC (YdhE family)